MAILGVWGPLSFRGGFVGLLGGLFFEATIQLPSGLISDGMLAVGARRLQDV